MEYELRSLKATDLFVLVSILGKVGVKEVGQAFKNSNVGSMIEEGDQERIGMEAAFSIAGIISENLNKAETEIFKFLADVSGLSVKDVKDSSLGDFTDLLLDVIQLPDFKEVFTRASRFTK